MLSGELRKKDIRIYGSDSRSFVTEQFLTVLTEVWQ